MEKAGFSTSTDVGVRLLAAVADVESMPRGFSIRRSDEAVGALSRICTAISLNPHRRFTIYHCCDPRSPVHEIEPADFGLYWREVTYASFRRACQARGEKSPLHGHWALLDHCAPYWLGDAREGAALPVCERAIREDCPVPIEWPGTLTMFRRFGDWIRRSESRWPHPVRESRLEFARLIELAERHAERAGVDFDHACPEWMRDGLERLVRALGAPETGLLENGNPPHRHRRTGGGLPSPAIGLLVLDPLTVVRCIYDRFGWKLEQTAATAMNEWLSCQSEHRRR